MSNLYKQRYIVADNGNARVINSNSKVEARMQELEKMMTQIPTQQGAVDGFVAGLQLEVVDAVPKEDEISPQETVQKAKEEADAILADAKEQVDIILADAEKQAEAIREEARNTGYETGLREGNEQAEAALTEKKNQMEEAHRLLEEDYRQKIEELEPYLVDVVSDVFEKVFHVQFDDKKEILLYLIQNVILSAEGTKDFQVRVSLKDYEFMEEHKDEITRRVGGAVNVEIMADAALKERQCMIETDSGVFDCGTDVQLDNLIKALRSLSL